MRVSRYNGHIKYGTIRSLSWRGNPEQTFKKILALAKECRENQICVLYDTWQIAEKIEDVRSKVALEVLNTAITKALARNIFIGPKHKYRQAAEIVNR